MKLALEENTKNGEPTDSKVAFPPKEDQQLLETLNGGGVTACFYNALISIFYSRNG